MFKWYLVVLASVAVLLLIAGLFALVLPEEYEGQEVYRFDSMHAVRMLDIWGSLLLVGGCVAACAAGAMWQQKVDGP